MQAIATYAEQHTRSSVIPNKNKLKKKKKATKCSRSRFYYATWLKTNKERVDTDRGCKFMPLFTKVRAD